jgi:hypothetical protein
VSTLYFPQLATGSISQFPGRKQILQRTIVNRTPGIGTVKMADPEGAAKRWDLRYSGLTDAELAALHDLFSACEGRLRDFVFPDPFGNLLRWTEDLSNSVWQGSVQTSAGIEDPNGGTSAWRLTNAAQAAQSLTQSVDAPGWYRYAFSLWVRSISTGTVTLRLENSDGFIAAQRLVSTDWERICVSGGVPGNAEEIRCCIELPLACAVDVFGPQLEAQADASGYRKTAGTSGVYTARFDQDEFECISNGPDNHSARIRVVSVRGITT